MSLLSCVASTAFADDPVSDAPAGQYAVGRDVQSPAGMFSARILLAVNLEKGESGEPISLAPDLYYAISDRVQIGLLHTDPMGWQTRPGVGLCLTGEDSNCPSVYDNVGFDLMLGLGSNDFPLSAHGSLFLDSFDPERTHLALGVAGKLHFSPRAALFFDPKIAIATDSRDVNDDVLYVPVELQFQLAAPTTFKLVGGFIEGLSDFGDTYRVPVGIGLVQNLTKHLDLGARFSFDNLLGKQADEVDRADERSLAILLNIRS
ncbi:MAG: hypothetical protein ABI867_39355 [Kofleriaceae bacterium]